VTNKIYVANISGGVSGGDGSTNDGHGGVGGNGLVGVNRWSPTKRRVANTTGKRHYRVGALTVA